MCSQLQECRHWSQAVASFWKNVEEKPCDITCCAAWQLAFACMRTEGGEDDKACSVGNAF